MRIVFLLLLFTASAAAQRHRIEELNAEKPEGKLLQQIMQEPDAAKKLPLLEQFVGEYPKHEYTPWVLEQLQQAFVKAGDPAKVIAAGDKLIALDPDDPEANLQNLKAAETQKDLAAIRKYSAATSAAARKMAAAPQPKDPDAVTAWKNEVEYAKQVDTYSDYALYRVAVESREPKVAIEFGEALVQHNPKGEYAAKLPQTLFTAYRQVNDNAKAVAIAEQVLATDQSNEDMLLVVANSYLEQKKEPQKVHDYSTKAADVVNTKSKPEGVADADWAARKTQVVGLAHYMNGKLYHNESNWAKADQELRAALPMVESSPGLEAVKPEVLYLLALSDFKLEKLQEAANYFRACSAIKSPFQQLATTNLARLKTQYKGIK